jgi:threonine dehydrogenase-like Zn-dependent dehydrogenase
VPTSSESPFVQAGRLIERAATFTPGDWQRVVHQAQALDAGAHVAAVRRLGARIVGHPQSRALDALNRNAGQAASRAGRAGRDLTAEQACAYAARITAQAALALALAPELAPPDNALLTAPFASVLHAGAVDEAVATPGSAPTPRS